MRGAHLTGYMMSQPLALARYEHLMGYEHARLGYQPPFRTKRDRRFQTTEASKQRTDFPESSSMKNKKTDCPVKITGTSSGKGRATVNSFHLPVTLLHVPVAYAQCIRDI